jgi:four helix bundle protein
VTETNFEKLRIYELAELLGDLMWSIASDWNRLDQDTVGKQVIRSADSIGANIAEGSGRGSDKDFIRFLRIARGSLYETRHWLRRAYRRELLSAEQANEVKRLLDELTPKLNAYIREVGRTKKVGERVQRPKA